MKIKSLILFVFLAVCISKPLFAQTSIANWDDFLNFLNSADTLGQLTTGVTATNNNAQIWASYYKTFDGGGYTLSGGNLASYGFALPSEDPVLDGVVNISSVTLTGFTHAIFNNHQDYTGQPKDYTSTVYIGPGVIFENNGNLSNEGSAIWNEFVTYVANGTIFRNNVGMWAGAVYNKDTMYFGDDVVFDNNATAANFGGGAIDAGYGPRTSDNWRTIIGDRVQFTNNTVPGTGYGGAIFNENSYVQIGEDAYFYNNSAALGGAIAAHIDFSGAPQPVTIIGGGAIFDTNIAASYYGGAIYNENGILTVYGADSIGNATSFQNNTSGYGGAIMSYTTAVGTPASAVIGAGAQFLNNTATTAGGAVFNWDAVMTLDTAHGLTTLFQGNTDSTGNNDIYLYSGGNGTPTLNITGDGDVDFYGGFRSNAAGGLIPLINKTSSGEMILEAGSLNHSFIGTFTQTAGITSVYCADGQFFSGVNNITDSTLHFYTSNSANTINVTNGDIDLTNTGGAYNTLTVSTWNANGARLHINTYLDGNGTSTDKLIVNGGPASGNTTLFVTSRGTNNAPTPAGSNGILVVDVTNATSNTATFALNGGVLDTGALKYTLNQASDQNWYLTSSGELTNTANTVANMPALHLSLVKAGMDELRGRMGEFISDDGPRKAGLWVRGYGEQLNVDEKISANMTLLGAAAGIDMKAASGDNNQLYLGVMGGYIYTDNIKIRQDNAPDGSGSGTVPSAGLYAIWNNDGGWFADATARYFMASMSMQNISAAGEVIAYDADRNFWAGSVEAGKSFSVSKFALQPKAEFRYAYADPTSHTTNMQDTVQYNTTNSLMTALRFQATYLPDGKDSPYQPFAEIGVYNEWMGKTDINFSGVNMLSDVGGLGVQASLGLNMRLMKNAFLFGDLSLDKGSVYEAYSGNVGVRFAF